MESSSTSGWRKPSSWGWYLNRLKESGTEVIDVHVHMGMMETTGDNATPEFLIRQADLSGTKSMMVTSLKSLKYDMETGNREVYQFQKRYPGRVFGYATISSQRYDKIARNEIRRCFEQYGFKGIKIYSYAAVSIDEPRTVDILKLAAESGAPVLAHSEPKECESLGNKVPEATLIMAHMGNTLLAKGDWNRAIMAAERTPNLYLDISGSPINVPFIEEACERVGANRILFGSDLPLFDARLQIAKVLDADISDDERRLILGGNAKRIAKL